MQVNDSVNGIGEGNRDEKQLHLVTPTIRSIPISTLTGFDVYLKLENLQIPGSFKIRGIGNHCLKVKVFEVVFSQIYL